VKAFHKCLAKNYKKVREQTLYLKYEKICSIFLVVKIANIL